MTDLVPIFLGALFVLAAAFALGNVWLRYVPVPRVIAFALGAASESTLIFLLLISRHASHASLIGLGTICLAGLLVRRVQTAPEPPMEPLDRRIRYLFAGIFAVYGLLYLVNALAPEIQADSINYHLGLVREYARLGKFPHRVGFYEMLPQGIEMLFLPAWVIGGASAAKLVQFAFLAATVPLIVFIGRALKLNEPVCWLAAALYAFSPVVGVAGTCAYIDAALVFFTLATFYGLLIWSRGGDRYLVLSGFLAGFCCAVKLTGLLTPILAAVFVLWRRRSLKATLLLAAGAFTPIACWMLRAAILTGDPAAPMLNRWFPNPYFHLASEQALARYMRSYGDFSFRHAALDLTVRGLQGNVGPIFLALPAALWILRYRTGRLIWAAALLLSVPWIWNVGARFLMPALPWFGLALAFSVAAIVPRAAVKAAVCICLVFHSVTCWPAVVILYDRPGNWRLFSFPWRSALRIQSEQDYLSRTLGDYHLAGLINKHTQPGERIFSLTGAPKSMIDREVLDYWHSAQAEQLTGALQSALGAVPLYLLRADWPPERLRGIRVRSEGSAAGEWRIQELWLYRGERQAGPERGWLVSAYPNTYEAPLAFDNNLALEWNSLEPMRPGMHLEAEFPLPRELDGADLISGTSAGDARVAFDGLGEDGRWKPLVCRMKEAAYAVLNPRREAVRAIRAAGFRYILTPVGSGGAGMIGADLLKRPRVWGVTDAASYGADHLMRIQ